ncbi:hypothetical protein EVJ58_g3743 [Rhodofomes roseus]|nr:hypothetical protein EVJ58_g3743 [Rhodofomes roseus]
MANTPFKGGHAVDLKTTSASTVNETGDAEDEDAPEDELDQLLEEFRGWKLDMKHLMEDFKAQLDELQEDFSKTLRAIPTDVAAMPL